MSDFADARTRLFPFLVTMTREERRAAMRARGQGLASKLLPFIFAFNSLVQVNLAVTRWHREPLAAIPAAFFAVAMLLLCAAWIRAWRVGAPPFTSAIFDERPSALVIYVEGKAFTIAWRSVAGVIDVGEYFYLERLFARPVVIPKSAFDDRGTALWAFLDDRLTSKRGLVRPRGVRTRIVNTATWSRVQKA